MLPSYLLSSILSPETCCDTVLLSNTDSYYFYYEGTWSLYTSKPSINGRKVYKMRNSCNGDYCLYWSNNAWRVDSCWVIPSKWPGRFHSSATSKKCPHGDDLTWQWDSSNQPEMSVNEVIQSVETPFAFIESSLPDPA